MTRALLIALLLSIAAPAHAGPLGTDRYDDQIKKSAELFLPGWDWRWWKAQLYQESRLNPSAVSPAGARGLAQIMPGTWRDEAPKLGYTGLSPHAAEPAIMVGAHYMQRMRRTWSADRSEADRRRLAQASYNAGAGNIIKAQRACNNARDWPQISQCLPQITGANATETITYVQRIERWYWILRT